MPTPFRLYNTLSHGVEDFTPIEPGKIRLYVCGMTVYDDAHVGHARAMVVFDAFVRATRALGWDVTFVRNFTDVDDKIIARSAERDMNCQELADLYMANFARDANALGLLTPTHEPQVSQSIDDILGLITHLVERGHAYAAEGSVWFDVASDSDYGKLSRQKIDELRSDDDATIASSGSGKRNAADFALWKSVKPGEPSWESPWGPGRPGWHIECSAMARAWLGDTIDIHGGGLDLVFPHHENEIAQSECGTGHPFARYWMHNGMLTMGDGPKMGKSQGNAFNIHDLLKIFPAEAIRLYYLNTHYRSPLPWLGQESLHESLAMVGRLYEARHVAGQMGGQEQAEAVADALGADAQTVLTLGRNLRASFESALTDDFNTSKALGLAFELARAINRMSNHKKAKKRGGPVVADALVSFGILSETLGLMQLSYDEFHQDVKAKRLPALGLTGEQVEALLEERRTARANKDWGRADAIRGELEDKQILVMDHADGSSWRLKL